MIVINVTIPLQAVKVLKLQVAQQMHHPVSGAPSLHAVTTAERGDILHTQPRNVILVIPESTTFSPEAFDRIRICRIYP
jgi:hypothetical protein